MGRSSATFGSKEEMTSLRTEHGVVITIILVLYAIHIHMGPNEVVKKEADIWIDTGEVLSRGRRNELGIDLRANGVLDYDLWRLMIVLQRKI